MVNLFYMSVLCCPNGCAKRMGDAGEFHWICPTICTPVIFLMFQVLSVEFPTELLLELISFSLLKLKEFQKGILVYLTKQCCDQINQLKLYSNMRNENFSFQNFYQNWILKLFFLSRLNLRKKSLHKNLKLGEMGIL